MYLVKGKDNLSPLSSFLKVLLHNLYHNILLFFLYSLLFSWICGIQDLYLTRVVIPSPTWPLIGHGRQPVMLADGIVMTDQLLTRQLQHYFGPYWAKERSERSDPINWQFMSSPNAYMIVLTVFLKLEQACNQPYFNLKAHEGGGWVLVMLREIRLWILFKLLRFSNWRSDIK